MLAVNVWYHRTGKKKKNWNISEPLTLKFPKHLESISYFNTFFHSICYNKNSFAQRDDVGLEKYGRLFIVSLISDTHH